MQRASIGLKNKNKNKKTGYLSSLNKTPSWEIFSTSTPLPAYPKSTSYWARRRLRIHKDLLQSNSSMLSPPFKCHTYYCHPPPPSQSTVSCLPPPSFSLLVVKSEQLCPGTKKKKKRTRKQRCRVPRSEARWRGLRDPAGALPQRHTPAPSQRAPKPLFPRRLHWAKSAVPAPG